MSPADERSINLFPGSARDHHLFVLDSHRSIMHRDLVLSAVALIFVGIASTVEGVVFFADSLHSGRPFGDVFPGYVNGVCSVIMGLFILRFAIRRMRSGIKDWPSYALDCIDLAGYFIVLGGACQLMYTFTGGMVQILVGAALKYCTLRIRERIDMDLGSVWWTLSEAISLGMLTVCAIGLMFRPDYDSTIYIFDIVTMMLICAVVFLVTLIISVRRDSEEHLRHHLPGGIHPAAQVHRGDERFEAVGAHARFQHSLPVPADMPVPHPHDAIDIDAPLEQLPGDVVVADGLVLVQRQILLRRLGTVMEGALAYEYLDDGIPKEFQSLVRFDTGSGIGIAGLVGEAVMGEGRAEQRKLSAVQSPEAERGLGQELADIHFELAFHRFGRKHYDNIISCARQLRQITWFPRDCRIFRLPVR